jgi:hypothetical protein
MVEGVKHDAGKPRIRFIPAKIRKDIIAIQITQHPSERDLCLALESDDYERGAAMVCYRMDLPVSGALLEIAKVMEYGANKYGNENWKGVEPYRYIDAAWRHIAAHYSGETYDRESGFDHLAHIGANFVILAGLS